MRKIERKLINHLGGRTPFSQGNTRLQLTNNNGFKLYLHDNLIAELKDDILTLDDCGWATKTSASRLNIVAKLYVPTVTVKIKQSITQFIYNNKIVLATGSIVLNIGNPNE